ncbi:TPA: signal peptidase I [Patescibacteria group bacterium]|nr:signal peptidase I [Candidatus Gracilibacteria bacterium]
MMFWKNKKIQEILFDLFDMISFLVFVGGIVLFVRFFVANPYTVVGASMATTFEENDFIIVDKITPRFGELKRGDVIVFVPPGKTVPYIKRIIGLPGETVKIHDNKVTICSIQDNQESCFDLDQSYLDDNVWTDTRCGISNFKVTS